MNISFPNSAASSSKVDSEQRVQNQNAPRSPENTGITPSDVSLTGPTVQTLRTQLTSVPDIRQERVTALRQAVNSGQYNPTGQQIADAIHSDLFGGPASGAS